MIYKLKLILGAPLTTNYQGQLYMLPFDEETEEYGTDVYISWIWISIDQVIAAGTYSIPEEQRDNLNWFYDNNFRLDKYGRRHIGYTMLDYVPDEITVL